MEAPNITTRLVSSFGGDVHVADGGDRYWLVASDQASRTVLLEIGEGTARIYAGRITDALSLEDDHDLEQVVAVIEAIRSGGAYEYFGYSTDPAFGFIGYEINAPGFSIVRVDEGARVLHRALV